MNPDLESDLVPRAMKTSSTNENGDGRPDSRTNSVVDQRSDRKAGRRTQVVFAGSHGGHLGQAMRLRMQLGSNGAVIATDEGVLSYPEDVIATVPVLHGPTSWIRNPIESALLAFRLKPKIVVSFGCRDVAFFCVCSKVIGGRLVLVESFARVRTPSRFLRALAPLADRILVQWPELKAEIPSSTLVHPVYSFRRPVHGPVRKVMVVVGTFRDGMDRLLRLVDGASPLPGSPLVTCQIGHSKYIPHTAEWYRWKPNQEFQNDISEADLIITHDGSNTIALALEAAKPVVVVPRATFELDYESSAELANELSRRAWVTLATTPEGLREAVARNTDIPPESDFEGPAMASCVADEIAKTRRAGRKRWVVNVRKRES
jgi:UDP-N-acetylglucosamine transferase subunit ALG13